MEIFENLRRSVERERRSYRFYMKAYERSGVEFFRFMAEEELKHRRFLEQVKDALLAGKNLDELNLKSENPPAVGKAEIESGLLEEAHLLEESSVVFYSKLTQSRLGGVFRKLAQAEEEHLRMISLLRGSIKF